MELRIDNSFEVPTQDEWNKYLGTDIFDDFRLAGGTLGETSNILQSIAHPCLHEIIQEHNNKVGSLNVTYAFCRHYYDEGIPDDLWFISPGSKGQSIEYFPKFNEEHWMRKYWFNYFSDTYYLKISAVWDSVIEIINEYYGYAFVQDLRFRNNMFKKLKIDNLALLDVFDKIQSDQLYMDAQKYRTAAAHGTSAGEITNTVSTKHDVMTQVTEVKDGKLSYKTVKAKTVVAVSAGEYTNAGTIMTNMEEYAKFSGTKLKEIVKFMESQKK